MKLIPISLVLCVIAAGCGSPEKLTYTNVSGDVMFNGKPLPTGTVTFAVAGYPPTVAQIVDGKYNGQAVIGSNTVSLSSKRKSETASTLPPAAIAQMQAYAKQGKGGAGNDDLTANMVEIMPEAWGEKSKQTRVVEAGGQNKFDFDVKGK